WGAGGVDVLGPAAEVGLVGEDVGGDALGLLAGKPVVRFLEVLLRPARPRGSAGTGQEGQQRQGRKGRRADTRRRPCHEAPHARAGSRDFWFVGRVSGPVRLRRTGPETRPTRMQSSSLALALAPADWSYSTWNITTSPGEPGLRPSCTAFRWTPCGAAALR